MEKLDTGFNEEIKVSVPDETLSVSERASPEAIQELLEKAEALKKKLEAEQAQIRSDLAFAITKKYEGRSRRRGSKELEMIESQMCALPSGAGAVVNVSSETPFTPEVQDSRPNMNMIGIKCEIAIAQQINAQFGGGDKNWNITAEPDMALDAQGLGMIAEKAEKMEQEIDNLLTNARYGPKLRAAMYDRVVLGTAVIKGPFNSQRLVRKYKQNDKGEWISDMSMDYTMGLERVDPWFFYPDDTVTDICDATDSIELHAMSALDLSDLAKRKGFDAKEIREVLKTPPSKYVSDNFTAYSKLSGSNSDLFKDKYRVFEYHGPVLETQLRTLDIEPNFESPIGEYYAEVWVVDGHVIRLKLHPMEGYFKIPYNVCVWNKDPTSIFGYGLPFILKDSQRVMNETWHMMLDNASLTSGPQVIVQKGIIEPANREWVFNPRKVWIHKDASVPVNQSMHFFTPPNTVNDLNTILEIVRRAGEEESGVPLANAGLDPGQVSTSATGTALLQQNSTLLGDFKAEAWDDAITEPVIQGAYDWIMQYGTNDAVKDNFKIDVRSSTDVKKAMIQLQNMEKMSVEAAQDEEAGMVIDRRQIMLARVAAMGIPKSMIRTLEQIAALEQQKAEQGPPPELMIQMKEMEIEERKLALEEARLQFELNQQQTREEYEFQERMGANMARMAEAEAAAVRTQNEKEIALIGLASKENMKMAELNSKWGIQTQNVATTQYLAGMKSVQEDKKLLLQEREMRYAEKNGKGI